eukprot:TRINITY_DN21745_c0_g2_i1.p1 TRINITY_DN21745_c0_g2~~TRINITY_DN21745_c0_g2_i1.p1  ORF type:complete len:642 (-),score=131.11 TRINITY_DN21745_c0_g2_i1:47-1972(-)
MAKGSAALASLYRSGRRKAKVPRRAAASAPDEAAAAEIAEAEAVDAAAVVGACEDNVDAGASVAKDEAANSVKPRSRGKRKKVATLPEADVPEASEICRAENKTRLRGRKRKAANSEVAGDVNLASQKEESRSQTSHPSSDSLVDGRQAPAKKLTKAARREAAQQASAQEEVMEESSEVPAPAQKPLSQEELSRVCVSGKDAESADFKPWLTFEAVRKGGPRGRLPAAVVAYMAKWKRFAEPTPIQAHCWPIACSRRDVIGLSKTGSGKTLAYMLPGLSHVLSVRTSKSMSFGPYVVVLAPTRELAIQIEKDVQVLCRAIAVKTVCIYGGAPKNEQIRSLGDGADVVVATPGRLDDFSANVDKFSGRSILSLSMVSYVVLDEADCMLDLGFEPQIRKIFSRVSKERQMLLFSATWPKKVQALADAFLKEPVSVRIGAGETSVAAGNTAVEQRVLILEVDKTGEADRAAKKTELWRLLWEQGDGTCIVFCAMKKTAAVLAHQLRQDGFKALGLHGDLPQQEREKNMATFKAGEARILVATDIAARGLDVHDVSLVVSYDPAVQLDDHVHRIGRTGRSGGRRGIAYALLGADDVRQARFVAESMRSSGQEVPENLAELTGRRLENAQSRRNANKKAKKKAAGS